MSDFSYVFAKLGAAGQDLAFEVRFNAMQNTLLKRANDEIEKVKAADKTGDKLKALEKQRSELTEGLGPVKVYQFAAEANVQRLYEAQSTGNEALPLLRNLDNSVKASLTADEVENINAKKDAILELADNVMMLSHPDINDGNVVFRLRQVVEDIRGLSAVEGDIPAEDDPNPVNGNRDFYDKLVTLQHTISVAYTGALDAREQAGELSVDMQTKLFEIEGEAADLTQVGVSKVVEEVEAIKLKYANLLKAISISFEASKSISTYLESGLAPQTYPTGSVMNLFS